MSTNQWRNSRVSDRISATREGKPSANNENARKHDWEQQKKQIRRIAALPEEPNTSLQPLEATGAWHILAAIDPGSKLPL
jgi:hypothetical protein